MSDDNSQKEPKDDVTLEPTDESEGEVDEVPTLEEVGIPTGSVGADKLKKLREKLKQALAEKQEYLTGWQRTKADFVNYKKGEEDSKKEFVKFANEKLITELIPVLDSFDAAFSNKEVWEKVDLNWRMGVQYIYSQLLKILENHHVKIIEPAVGESYNPRSHEATEMVETSDESQNGKIVSVMNKGYKIGNRMIRPPKVKVGEVKK